MNDIRLLNVRKMEEFSMVSWSNHMLYQSSLNGYLSFKEDCSCCTRKLSCLGFFEKDVEANNRCLSNLALAGGPLLGLLLLPMFSPRSLSLYLSFSWQVLEAPNRYLSNQAVSWDCCCCCGVSWLSAAGLLTSIAHRWKRGNSWLPVVSLPNNSCPEVAQTSRTWGCPDF